jgi:hypothetical protein
MPQHPYAGLLGAGAAVLDDSALERLTADLSAPVRVGVTGRAGAGRGMVRRALRGAGALLADPGEPIDVLAAPGEPADVDVYVFVETLTPDDVALLSGVDRPSVAVLNKADLTCFRGEGPLAVAAARCRELQRRTGVPTRPLAALLAVAASSAAAGEGSLIDALRTVGADPARLTPGMRHRLLAELDLFGTAIAAAAVGRGADAPELAALLHQASGISAVLEEIDRAGAPIRYRRLIGALARLADLAVRPRGARVAEFLAGDAVALARMAAAMDVVGAQALTDDPVGAAALTVDPAGGCAAHLRRAIHWRRYAQGPVSALHRGCGTDISRGALRLWLQAGGVVESMP